MKFLVTGLDALADTANIVLVSQIGEKFCKWFSFFLRVFVVLCGSEKNC